MLLRAHPSKRLRQLMLAGVSATSISLSIACSDRCATEREQTDRLLEEARHAGASVYSAVSLGQAAGLAAKADTDCRSERWRFLSWRSHAGSRRLHLRARAAANEAAREARMGLGIARQEALNARLSAAEAVEQARISLLRTRDIRGDASSASLIDDLERLQRSLGILQGRIDHGDFLEAREAGIRIRQEAIRLEGEANSHPVTPRTR